MAGTLALIFLKLEPLPSNYFINIFTALHVMQTRYCEENCVCPSVRLSVTRVYCDKTEEKSVQIFIRYER